MAKAKIFEFGAHLTHTETVSDGGIDFEGLLGDPFLALSAQRTHGPHVVEPIGELDHDDPDVVDHGEEHLANAFGLALLAGVEVELGQLRDAIDAPSDIVAETLSYIFDGYDRVFDRVVEKSGFETNQIHRHITENMGHFEWVGHVGLAGGAGLTGMMQSRVLKGLAK